MARKSRKVDYVNIGNKENLVTEAENQCEKVSHAALYARLSYESEKNRERNTIETQMVLLHNFVKEQKVSGCKGSGFKQVSDNIFLMTDREVVLDKVFNG